MITEQRIIELCKEHLYFQGHGYLYVFISKRKDGSPLYTLNFGEIRQGGKFEDNMILYEGYTASRGSLSDEDEQYAIYEKAKIVKEKLCEMGFMQY